MANENLLSLSGDMSDEELDKIKIDVDLSDQSFSARRVPPGAYAFQIVELRTQKKVDTKLGDMVNLAVVLKVVQPKNCDYVGSTVREWVPIPTNDEIREKVGWKLQNFTASMLSGIGKEKLEEYRTSPRPIPLGAFREKAVFGTVGIQESNGKKYARVDRFIDRETFEANPGPFDTHEPAANRSSKQSASKAPVEAISDSDDLLATL